MSSVPGTASAIGLTHAELDICDRSAVMSFVCAQPSDIIINTGAYTAVDRAESTPDLAARVNIDGPANLAMAARDTGARLLHLSTDFVFDGLTSTTCGPDAPTRPLSVYGKTKLAGEQAVQEILPDRSVIVRTAWVYASTGSNFVRTMVRLMREKGHVRVVADQVGTPTAAISLAEVIWALVHRPDLNGVYHWTDAGVASWYDFAVAISEESATVGLLSAGVRVDPITTEDYPTPAKRPPFSVLDTRALRGALSVTPRHWRENLRTVLKEMSRA